MSPYSGGSKGNSNAFLMYGSGNPGQLYFNNVSLDFGVRPKFLLKRVSS